MIYLLLAIGFVSHPTFAQDHPALVLCREGKRAESLTGLSAAVRTKEFQGNAEAWNCLGLALYNDSKDEDSIKAFRKAASLSPSNAPYRTNLAHVQLMKRKIDSAQGNLKNALRIDPQYAHALYLSALSDTWEGKMDRALSTVDKLIIAHPGEARGYILKGDISVLEAGMNPKVKYEKSRYADVLREVVTILTDGRSRITDAQQTEKIESELKVKSIFAEYFAREPLPESLTPADPRPGVEPLKVLSKTKAAYTDRARMAGVQGTITFAVIFGADNKITETMFLKRLGYGLDEQALHALRQITFEAEKRDGKPVSVVRPVSFSFNIY
jgi:TonB family protein